MKKTHLHHVILFILTGALVFVLLFQYVNNSYEKTKLPLALGTTYSPHYAEYLGLNPQQTYLQVLDDLKIKRIRLPVYWDEIEPSPGKFDFKQLDFYVQQATERQAQIILAVGYKVPRWPECYPPKWLDITKDQFPKAELEQMLVTVIKRYDSNPAVVAWQVENEPFFPFGNCVDRTKASFEDELKLVKALTKKPIVVTDSGEFSPWVDGMKQSDIFGTTLYRDANFPIYGRIYFPFQPWYYRLRAELVRKFLAPNNHKTIVIELQAETWTEKGILNTPLKEQIDSFPVEQLFNNVEYAQRAGMDEIYLWGIEWYFYLDKLGHPEYLEAVKTLK